MFFLKYSPRSPPRLSQVLPAAPLAAAALRQFFII